MGRRKGYIARSPISDDSSLVRSKHAQRARRVTPEEEAAILKAARTVSHRSSVRLYGLIVAALETGCRLGELLGCQWSRRGPRSPRGPHPWREHERRGDAAACPSRPARGRPGDGTDRSGGKGIPNHGLRLRRPWRARQEHEEGLGVVRAARVRTRTPMDRTREAQRRSHAPLSTPSICGFMICGTRPGSRWMEGGWPIHHVKEMLGHANISQTDTYLNAGGWDCTSR